MYNDINTAQPLTMYGDLNSCFATANQQTQGGFMADGWADNRIDIVNDERLAWHLTRIGDRL